MRVAKLVVGRAAIRALVATACVVATHRPRCAMACDSDLVAGPVVSVAELSGCGASISAVALPVVPVLVVPKVRMVPAIHPFVRTEVQASSHLVLSPQTELAPVRINRHNFAAVAIRAPQRSRSIVRQRVVVR